MSNKVPCQLCNRDMSSPKTVSCLRRKGIEFADGSVYAAIPYGPQPSYDDVDAADDRCRDCGVGHGGSHHQNCCIETCPKCHGQALDCDTCQPVAWGNMTTVAGRPTFHELVWLAIHQE